VPHLRKVSIDPLKGLVPVTQFVEGTFLVAVHPSVPANSIQELADYAKQYPGKLRWGTPGIGAYGHLICETFKQQAGVDILHMPYLSPTSWPASCTSKAPGHLASSSPARPLLAVLGHERRPDFPKVPPVQGNISGPGFSRVVRHICPNRHNRCGHELRDE
jgi:Tripartite tricarboxylate transporter family receptor